MVTPHHGPANGDRSDSSAHPDDLRDPAPANTGSYDPPDDDDPSTVPTVVDEPCDLPAHFAATITRGDVPPLPGGNGGDDGGDDDEGRPRITFDLTAEGRPRTTRRNVLAVLATDRRWHLRLRYNDRSAMVELDGVPLTDEDVTRIGVELDEVHGIRNATPPMVLDAINVVARAHRFDPVRVYLDGLRWDGVERLPTVLADYFAAATPEAEGIAVSPADSKLLRAYGVATFIGAVARVYDPGCKVDTVLVLCGPQGSGKSTGIAALVPDPRWYRDSEIAPGSKDAVMQTEGGWLYELPEVDGWSRNHNDERIKAFLTSGTDRFRRPYGRLTEDVPRRFVFVGTTNTPDFLRDATGSRRFWPVTVARYRDVDVALLTADRDQLWAEAVHRYRKGEASYLSHTLDELRALDAEAFQVVDPWASRFREWIASPGSAVRDGFTIKAALTGVGVDSGRQTPGDGVRLGKVLRVLGYVPRRDLEPDGTRVTRWYRP